MSAFLCSSLQTVVCALIIARQDSYNPTIESTQAFAKTLRKVNNRALFCRYGDKPQYLPRDISAEFANAATWLDSHDGNAWAGVAHCLQYQCSEGDTASMKEWAFIDELIKRVDSMGDHSTGNVWSI